jgi:alanine racemase
MQQDLYGTRLYVNFSHLKYNIGYIKKLAKNLKIIAMIKANAYGHGDIAIARTLQALDIDYFGVADFEEGIRLRNHNITLPIMVMNPGVNNISAIIENNLEPVIYSNSIFSTLIEYMKNSQKDIRNNVRVHIKINTGMNRWGVNLSDIPIVINKLASQKNIAIGSVYTHLASAENEHDDTFTKHQINELIKAQEVFQKEFNHPVKTHISNTSAFLRNFESNRLNYMRIGLLIYGGIEHKLLKPIAELKCPISQIREIEKGDSVGYGRNFIAESKLKIGVLPFGYADGLQRAWGNGVLKFYFQNQLIPTVGNISMDSCVVDLSGIDNISVGDDVIYFGEKRPIWDLANELDTIPYEITSTLSRRIKRIYVH